MFRQIPGMHFPGCHFVLVVFLSPGSLLCGSLHALLLLLRRMMRISSHIACVAMPCFFFIYARPTGHFRLILRAVLADLLRGGYFQDVPHFLPPSVFSRSRATRCSLPSLFLPFLSALALMFLGFFAASLSIVLLLHLFHSGWPGRASICSCQRRCVVGAVVGRLAL